MSTRMTIAKILLSLAAITLVATSVLHGSGYASISKSLGESSLPGPLAVGLRGLWVDFSVQLVILAALLGVTVARPNPGARVLLLVCGLGLAVDTVVLGTIVGLFVGTFALSLASVLTLAGWATYRSTGG